MKSNKLALHNSQIQTKRNETIEILNNNKPKYMNISCKEKARIFDLIYQRP